MVTRRVLCEWRVRRLTAITSTWYSAPWVRLRSTSNAISHCSKFFQNGQDKTSFNAVLTANNKNQKTSIDLWLYGANIYPFRLRWSGWYRYTYTCNDGDIQLTPNMTLSYSIGDHQSKDFAHWKMPQHLHIFMNSLHQSKSTRTITTRSFLLLFFHICYPTKMFSVHISCCSTQWLPQLWCFKWIHFDINIKELVEARGIHYLYTFIYFMRHITLQWRHNGRDSVSNHQPHDCLLNRLFRRRSKKTSKLRVTGLCEGNSPWNGEFPAQRTSNVENVSICWRHHDKGLYDLEQLYDGLPHTMHINRYPTFMDAVLTHTFLS